MTGLAFSCLNLVSFFIADHNLKTIGHLPKGVSPYTLLLSNNAISKVENLQYFIHLQQVRDRKFI